MAVSDLFATKRRAHSRRFYFGFFLIFHGVGMAPVQLQEGPLLRVACGAALERGQAFSRAYRDGTIRT